MEMEPRPSWSMTMVGAEASALNGERRSVSRRLASTVISARSVRNSRNAGCRLECSRPLCSKLSSSGIERLLERRLLASSVGFFAQNGAADFSGGGFGQFVAKLDRTRTFIWRESPFEKNFEFLVEARPVSDSWF